MDRRIMDRRIMDKNNGILLFWICFLTFVGYYVILLFLFTAGLDEVSRKVTIPIRLLVGMLLLFYAVRNWNGFKKNEDFIYSLFFLFCFFYFTRLLIDYNLEYTYYISPLEVGVYFCSFAVLPFLCISLTKINDVRLKAIFNSILYGGGVFGILFLFSYGKFIGSVGRLASGSVGENVLSPLAVSYTSTLVIGVLLFYLLTNRTTFLRKLISISVIILCTIPFFLGASRGSLIALFVPILFYFFSKRNLKVFVIGTVLIIMFIFLLVYLDTALNSGLIDRFLDISEAIETGSSSASRIVIWKASFNQFLNHPILGDRLEVERWQGYPHNIFIEALQTTGLLGFIPFVILVFKGLKISYYIFRYHVKYAWVTIIFIQAFMQNMFSGAVYTASWFWTSIGLLFALKMFLMEKSRNNLEKVR